MNGIHDMGGMHGFGAVVREPDEPVFHARWEGRVRGMVSQVVGLGWATIDAFRHGIERMDPVAYLSVGYYGRWLTGLETILVDNDILAPGEVDARLAHRQVPPRPPVPAPRRQSLGFAREVATAPRFAAGDSVRVRNLNPSAHTRLPRYARGKVGVIDRVHGGYVFPDTNAHNGGEAPQHLYSVRFDGPELWGPDAEAGTTVRLDLFESYIEAA